MAHNQVAFGDMSHVQAAMNASLGSRPTIALAGPSGMEGLGDIIAAYWRHEPSARLSMPACAEQLACVLHRLEAS
eukprot:3674471-Prymnesium_polylepis.2